MRQIQNQENNEALDKYALNMKLYANMLEIFEQRNKILLQKYQGPFVEEILRRSQSSITNYNIMKWSKVLQLKSKKSPQKKDQT